jgi:hypothetical protein
VECRRGPPASCTPRALRLIMRSSGSNTRERGGLAQDALVIVPLRRVLGRHEPGLAAVFGEIIVKPSGSTSRRRSRAERERPSSSASACPPPREPRAPLLLREPNRTIANPECVAHGVSIFGATLDPAHGDWRGGRAPQDWLAAWCLRGEP